MLKLPRQIETHPSRAAVEARLSATAKLWAGGALEAAEVPFTPAFEAALGEALRDRHLERGLDHIDQVLERERRGLEAARARQGLAAAGRISRLLVIASDGSERFHRQCESILRRHGDRVLAVRVDVPSSRLSENLFGADKLVKAVLVSDRDAVGRALLALAD